jgi:uncharacterized protein (TIGR02996 family)
MSALHWGKSEDDFLNSISEFPNNHHLKRVYADWLMDRELPRGEFIALQFLDVQQKQDPTIKLREQELLRQHATSWLEDLHRVLLPYPLRFEHGFVQSAVFESPSLAATQSVVGHRGWATLEELSTSPNSPHLPTLELLTHPVMRSLKSVAHLDESTAISVCRSPIKFPWNQLGVFFSNKSNYNTNQPLSKSFIEALSSPDSLPNLRHLFLFNTWLSPRNYRWLWNAPVTKQLDSLCLPCHYETIPIWLQELNTRSIQVNRLCLRVWSCDLTMEQDTNQQWSILSAKLHPQAVPSSNPSWELARCLQQFPPDSLTKLYVTSSGSCQVAPILAAVQRQRYLKTLSICA